MSRGNAKTKKHDIEPDDKFGSVLVSKFINYVMLNGKKTIAKRVVYSALEDASKKVNIKSEDLFEQVMKNVGPIVEVRGKRIGGANYQVPMEVSANRKNTLAMRWILNAARGRKGKSISEKLAEELISAYNNEGAAIRKKEETHRMAEANKAFAHFARF